MTVYKVALVQKETIPNNLEENQKRMCCWIEEAEKKEIVPGFSLRHNLKSFLFCPNY